MQNSAKPPRIMNTYFSSARFEIIALLALLLGACASHPPITDVSSGMSSQEVKAALGAPSDKSFEGSQEKWIYSQDDGSQKVLTFKSGKLVTLGTEKDGKPAGAVITPAAAGTPGASLCAGTNDYGSFAEGGGCNLYGCWPKGGYCNGFGCTATGRCTNQGCPKKISTFHCTE